MKKKIYSAAALTLLILANPSYGQFQRLAPGPDESRCGTEENEQHLRSINPKYDQMRQQYEAQIQQWIAAHPNNNQPEGLITIPTVIHIVWNTSTQNISNTTVNGIMQALNEDYGRTNPDASSTPAVWQPIAANTNVQFCLAQRDPNNAPTTGIERRQTTVTAFTTNNNVKFFANGGLDSWDVTRYFNIWICNLTSGLGGYGEFPTGSPSNTFGNVTDYAVAGYGQWVATHEGGHCFNLRHIWGDDGGACTGSDLCADTPNQANASSSPCPTFPATDACSPSSPGYMFMNYMDYGGNACKNLFTNNQSTRINAVLNNPPYNALATSNGCVPVNLVTNDAGMTGITTPSGTLCTTTFTPVVTLRNWGSNTLTSVTINYQIDAGPVQTQNWTGSLASLASTNVTLGSMTTTNGTHTFTTYTSNPNGVPDNQTSNDQTTGPFNTFAVGNALPLIEGFESTTFPPTGWTLVNPDASVTWARTTLAAHSGVASAFMNSINYPCNGCIDELHTYNIDLTSQSSPAMYFWVAYKLLSDPNQNPNWSDTLRVDISTNCGAGWTNLYYRYQPALNTTTPLFSTTPFVPTASEWRQEIGIINLGPYSGNNNVILRFKWSNDYENRGYIDDINISGTTGMSNTDPEHALIIYPNPSSGIFSIDAKMKDAQNLKVEVYNVLGTRVASLSKVNVKDEVFPLDLSKQSSGVYLVKVTADDKTFTKKVSVEK